MAVPSMSTFYAGQRLRAADMNSQVRNATNWALAAKVCKVQRTTAQTIANAAAPESISFNLDVFDILAWHSNSVNPERITPDLPGYYQVNGNVCFAFDANGSRRAYILTDNATVVQAQSGMPGQDATSSLQIPLCISALIYLDGSTDVQLGVYQNSGADLNTSVTGVGPSTLSVQWVGT